jgi:hypothetical protein
MKLVMVSLFLFSMTAFAQSEFKPVCADEQSDCAAKNIAEVRRINELNYAVLRKAYAKCAPVQLNIYSEFESNTIMMGYHILGLKDGKCLVQNAANNVATKCEYTEEMTNILAKEENQLTPEEKLKIGPAALKMCKSSLRSDPSALPSKNAMADMDKNFLKTDIIIQILSKKDCLKGNKTSCKEFESKKAETALKCKQMTDPFIKYRCGEILKP